MYPEIITWDKVESCWCHVVCFRHSQAHIHTYIHITWYSYCAVRVPCVCVCVCARARARACVSQSSIEQLHSKRFALPTQEECPHRSRRHEGRSTRRPRYPRHQVAAARGRRTCGMADPWQRGHDRCIALRIRDTEQLACRCCRCRRHVRFILVRVWESSWAIASLHKPFQQNLNHKSQCCIFAQPDSDSG